MRPKIKYKTIEGYLIEIGNLYQLRDGKTALILRYANKYNEVVGVIEGEDGEWYWSNKGVKSGFGLYGPYDIMRPVGVVKLEVAISEAKR